VIDKKPYEFSDEELIKGALKKDKYLQEMLYRKYADGMFSVACNYSDNDDDAADILQDGFIKVFKKLDSHDPSKSLGGWIRRIIINTALDQYKRKKRHLEIVEDYHLEETEDLNLFENYNAIEIVKYVNDLPEKAKMVLKLYAIEGYGHQEIATSMNISVGTSKSQLNRAKHLLKLMISGSNG
jgi:RNA polymerase sigma-70 factor (ECF subfamily)